MEGDQEMKTEAQPSTTEANADQIKSGENQKDEEMKEEDNGMIKRVGQIMNENGEWEEYVEYEEKDKPPIAYTYMGSDYCPIEPG